MQEKPVSHVSNAGGAVRAYYAVADRSLSRC